jgi:hypothetical protein
MPAHTFNTVNFHIEKLSIIIVLNSELALEFIVTNIPLDKTLNLNM